MKKIVAAFAAAVVAVGLAPSAVAETATPSTSTAPSAGTAAYRPPPIAWGACTNTTLAS